MSSIKTTKKCESNEMENCDVNRSILTQKINECVNPIHTEVGGGGGG